MSYDDFKEAKWYGKVYNVFQWPILLILNLTIPVVDTEFEVLANLLSVHGSTLSHFLLFFLSLSLSFFFSLPVCVFSLLQNEKWNRLLNALHLIISPIVFVFIIKGTMTHTNNLTTKMARVE